MPDPRVERARWIARHIVPLEPMLRGWLKRRVERLAGLEIDDVVQETYAVLGALAGVDHIRSPRAYLFQTAHSLVLAHARRARIVPIEFFAEFEHFDLAADLPSPEAEASARQELRLLGAAVLALPTRQREAFRLLKLEGLSQRDAAARMGIAESTLEKHVARALHTLVAMMGRGGTPMLRASEVDETVATDERDEAGQQRRD